MRLRRQHRPDNAGQVRFIEVCASPIAEYKLNFRFHASPLSFSQDNRILREGLFSLTSITTAAEHFSQMYADAR